MHQYQTRLASKISYYLPKARTNYGKFNIRLFLELKVEFHWRVIKIQELYLFQNPLKRIAYLQLLTGSLMYFIFQFLRAHFPLSIVIWVCECVRER